MKDGEKVSVSKDEFKQYLVDNHSVEDLIKMYNNKIRDDSSDIEV